ncbi:hypothetical protein ACH42_15675 [Endozoicomonas sp. (ex Bugula neritina AB1)]|nr:hypothetical protein ACH42_15675 [Endozoicomonas sp. (ex Bugula neritina AB1)]
MLFSRYIAAAFFPESDPLAGTMSVVLLFLTGYIARPIGGMIAGHLGDHYGRKKLFMGTIALMSLATLGIGVLPTYEHWGSAALWLLTLFRLIQGLAVGGELPGSTTFAAEHVTPDKRGLVTGTIVAAVTFGNVLGASLGWCLNTVLSSEEMYLWGWRIPFVLGGLLGVLGVLARRQLVETPVFLNCRRAVKVPVWLLLKSSWKESFAGVVYASVTATIVSVFLYLPTYFGLSNIGSSVSSYQFTTIGFLFYSVLTLPFAWLSDRIGRRRQLMLGSMLLLPVSVISVWLVDSGDTTAILTLLILIAISGAVVNGAYEGAIVELFPTEIRYSGVAFSHNLGFVIYGGLTPFVLTALAQSGVNVAPVVILIPVSLTLLLVSWCMPCRSLLPLEQL